MQRKGIRTTGIGVILTLALGWGCSADHTQPVVTFDHEYQQFQRLLTAHVDKAGLVDYRGLAGDSLLLDSVVASFGVLPPVALQSFTSGQELAFWINAYNAFTLDAIADAYPVSSVREINGMWDQQRYTVAGESLTLRQIERGVLSKKFTEPRVHFAIGCTTANAPVLATHPYQGATLDEQLATAALRFLVDTTRNQFYPATKTMELSDLFNECGSDFVKQYWSNRPSDQDELNRAVLSFISTVLPESLTGPLRDTGWTINYRPIDWSLNDQARPRTSTAMTE